MIADFFTKPLQGALFKKFRDIVLGYKHISTLHENDKDSSPQERVRKDSFETNFKWYDNGLSVDSSVRYGMSYAKAVGNNEKTNNRMMIGNDLILLK